MNDFHFLNPYWFLALLPVVVLAVWIGRHHRHQHHNEWSAHVDAHLLNVLAVAGQGASVEQGGQRRWWVAGMLAVLCTILALAGPAWQRVKTPSFSGNVPTVIVFSLAQSMNSDDLKPNRLTRATHKIRDILAATQGDSRGLVIYSDTAFVAAPLTNDAQIIEQLLPELSTTLMPVLGNRLDIAINEAVGVLQRANAARGRIVVLADNAGDAPKQSDAAATAAKNAGYTLSVIGVGTTEGATLQTADGRAITRNGQAMHSALAIEQLQQLAALGGGEFALISAGDSDVNRVLNDNIVSAVGETQQDLASDTWANQGYWLLIVPVLVLPWFFRRGMVFALVLVAGSALLTTPKPTMAQSTPNPATEAKSTDSAGSNWWQNLWKTPNQQGQQAFDQGNYDTAAKHFENPDWQAAADYKAGDYQAAAEKYQAAGQHYNAGNALANAGDFQGALTAYDAALKANPDDKNAEFNRDIVKKLLEEQEKAQQNSENNQNEQNQGDNSQEQQNQDGESQGSQSQEQSQDNQEQQDGDDSQQSDAQQNPSDSQQQNNDSQDTENTDDNTDSNADQQEQNPSSDENKKQNGEPQQPTEQGEETPAEELPEWENEARPDEANPDEQDSTDNAPLAVAAPPLDQATEQQLRRVPDDPSGLLRHRIRQHYLRQGLGQ